MMIVYGDDHPEYALTLTYLSNALDDLEDYEGAKLGYLKAL